MGVELTLYGPARALHSGHYGNWAPNPLVGMAHLVASMRNGAGRILIESFYDDVLPPSRAEREAIAAAPSADSALRAELLLAGTEAGNAPLMERIMLPALNVRGVSGGGVGALATNAVPAVARASIDFRLVPNQTPAHVRSLVEAHMRRQGFSSWPATRPERSARARAYPQGGVGGRLPGIPCGHVASRVARRGSGDRDGGGERVIVVPTSGGSLPLYHFDEVLRTPLITVPIVNHDNNQHAANENLRLQNLFDGIQVYAGIIAHLGRVWVETP
jgi:acetylornithine deacetylase/succinyl-diaminopimelate desuccinylase-like protein